MLSRGCMNCTVNNITRKSRIRREEKREKEKTTHKDQHASMRKALNIFINPPSLLKSIEAPIQNTNTLDWSLYQVSLMNLGLSLTTSMSVRLNSLQGVRISYWSWATLARLSPLRSSIKVRSQSFLKRSEDRECQVDKKSWETMSSMVREKK